MPIAWVGRVDIFLVVLISLNVLAIVMESEPGFQARFGDVLYGAVTGVTSPYPTVVKVAIAHHFGKIFWRLYHLGGDGHGGLARGYSRVGLSDQLHRRREAYKDLLDDVFEDGVVTEEEQTELAAAMIAFATRNMNKATSGHHCTLVLAEDSYRCFLMQRCFTIA